MPPMTFEGIVENGQVRLPESVSLPENAKVYVVIPDMKATQPYQILSPRLVNPADVAKFTMEVSEEPDEVRIGWPTRLSSVASQNTLMD